MEFLGLKRLSLATLRDRNRFVQFLKPVEDDVHPRSITNQTCSFYRVDKQESLFVGSPGQVVGQEYRGFDAYSQSLYGNSRACSPRLNPELVWTDTASMKKP